MLIGFSGIISCNTFSVAPSAINENAEKRAVPFNLLLLSSPSLELLIIFSKYFQFVLVILQLRHYISKYFQFVLVCVRHYISKYFQFVLVILQLRHYNCISCNVRVFYKIIFIDTIEQHTLDINAGKQLS